MSLRSIERSLDEFRSFVLRIPKRSMLATWIAVCPPRSLVKNQLTSYARSSERQTWRKTLENSSDVGVQVINRREMETNTFHNIASALNNQCFIYLFICFCILGQYFSFFPIMTYGFLLKWRDPPLLEQWR